MHRDPADVVADQLDLAGVQPNRHCCVALTQGGLKP
jgi:hypothetical protein